MTTTQQFDAFVKAQGVSGKSGRITIRSSRSGTVNIAKLWVGRRMVYETRAWGTSHNAFQDAESQAGMLGVTVKSA